MTIDEIANRAFEVKKADRRRMLKAIKIALLRSLDYHKKQISEHTKKSARTDFLVWTRRDLHPLLYVPTVEFYSIKLQARIHEETLTKRKGLYKRALFFGTQITRNFRVSTVERSITNNWRGCQ